MATVCTTCGRSLSLFERIQTAKTKRCPQCEQHYHQIQQHWLAKLEYAFMQQGVSATMEQELYQQFRLASMPPDLGQPVIQRLQYLRQLSEIRWGNIPVIRASVHLDSDEMAHFDIPATYFKPNKQIKPIPGHLVGSNKKCYFYSQTGKNNATIDWNNVGRIDITTIQAPTMNQSGVSILVPVQVIHLSVSKGSGGGAYQVPDPFYIKTLMDTLVRIWKRQLVLYKENATHGAIPEHIKAAVFQRDGGKCVQCGYEGPYIEYDHIIPRSKGGPHTVDNIQLLCRMCNLKKGDRL